MRNLLLGLITAGALALLGQPVVQADETKPKPAMKMEHEAEEDEHDKAGMKMQDAKDCKAPVHLTAAAEAKLGGGHYEGKLPKAAKGMGKMKMGAMPAANVAPASKKMPGMKGAHNVHKGVRGGEFIMVPNQMHHMEVVYSLNCGVQLFLYNAFTEPIRADRFHAFILIVPEGGDSFFEVMRFLVPSADGSNLHTPIDHHHDDPKNPKGLFEVELYIKFPEEIHPRKFDLVIGTEA